MGAVACVVDHDNAGQDNMKKLILNGTMENGKTSLWPVPWPR